MSISDKVKKLIGVIAEDASSVFEAVVKAARARLLASPATGAQAVSEDPSGQMFRTRLGQ